MQFWTTICEFYKVASLNSVHILFSMDGKAVQLFGAEILSCGCFLLTLLMKLVSSELLVSVCADVLVLCCVSGNVVCGCLCVAGNKFKFGQSR